MEQSSERVPIIRRFECELREQLGRKVKVWMRDGGEPFSGTVTEFSEPGGYVAIDGDTVLRLSEIVAFTTVADA